MNRVYCLNAVAGLLTAFQSVFILMILSRTSMLKESGIYAFAYATANLFVTIGNFGMRNYQVSDLNEEFRFENYVLSRGISCMLMLLVSMAYTGYFYLAGKYPSYKAGVILLMCVWKMADSAGDVFYGELQKRNRLDLASKSVIIRNVAAVLGFIFVVVCSGNLLYACLAGCLLSYALLIMTLWVYRGEYGSWDYARLKIERAGTLLRACTPLVLHSFLSFYLVSAPKYAIDGKLNDEAQAIYSYISMPVFVIELLSGFLLQPVLVEMSREWKNGDMTRFRRRVGRQLLVILLITGIVLAVGFAAGIPVLSALYHISLAAYRKDFVVLLASGGILAAANFFILVLTIMRRQGSFPGLYGVMAVFAYFVTGRLVGRHGITGAACSYLSIVGLLCVALGMIYRNAVHAHKDSPEGGKEAC